NEVRLAADDVELAIQVVPQVPGPKPPVTKCRAGELGTPVVLTHGILAAPFGGPQLTNDVAPTALGATGSARASRCNVATLIQSTFGGPDRLVVTPSTISAMP